MATNPVRFRKIGPQLDLKDERGRRLKKELDDIIESASFRRIVEEAKRDASVKSEAKADPKGFLQRKGIRIPEGLEVRFREKGPPGQKIRPQPDPNAERLEKELDDIIESASFRRIVEEVARDASVKSEAKADPKGFLQRKGIRIPEGVEVRFTEESSGCFEYWWPTKTCWYEFLWISIPYPCEWKLFRFCYSIEEEEEWL